MDTDIADLGLDMNGNGHRYRYRNRHRDMYMRGLRGSPYHGLGLMHMYRMATWSFWACKDCKDPISVKHRRSMCRRRGFFGPEDFPCHNFGVHLRIMQGLAITTLP